MHGHDILPTGLTDFPGWLELVPLVLLAFIIAFLSGLFAIPAGYDRGKVKWLMWCGTGMHAHIVYWHSEDEGRRNRGEFQSIHPKDLQEG